MLRWVGHDASGFPPPGTSDEAERIRARQRLKTDLIMSRLEHEQQEGVRRTRSRGPSG